MSTYHVPDAIAYGDLKKCEHKFFFHGLCSACGCPETNKDIDAAMELMDSGRLTDWSEDCEHAQEMGNDPNKIPSLAPLKWLRARQ